MYRESSPSHRLLHPEVNPDLRDDDSPSRLHVSGRALRLQDKGPRRPGTYFDLTEQTWTNGRI